MHNRLKVQQVNLGIFSRLMQGKINLIGNSFKCHSKNINYLHLNNVVIIVYFKV